MDIDERYTRGKIYKIVCNETNEVYYGSTIQKYVSDRISRHKNRKNCRSRQILDRNNYYYELIEDYSCNNKKELETRERWYIENNECINKFIPTRTKKEYYENNKETMVEKQKEYYQQNKERIAERDKQKITCDICGFIGNKKQLKRHQKTKKCLSKIEKLNTKTI